MKIGIVSLLNMKNVNYGNRLQAFALNRYLQDLIPNSRVESICLNQWGKKHITSVMKYIVGKWRQIVRQHSKTPTNDIDLSSRLARFNKFILNNISVIDRDETLDEIIKKQNFDVIVVGSDVIWGQQAGYVDRNVFLDFPLSNDVKKVSYAASFGAATIPNENLSYVVNQLRSFDAVGVRESSTTKLLQDNGLQSAQYTLDPTLLLSRDEWEKIEEKPKGIELDKNRGFIFSYVLGSELQTRLEIKRLAEAARLSVFTVPFANGTYNEFDKSRISSVEMDLSPQEWIWMIHHATFVITDSFHASAFSTIFKTNFVVAERHLSTDINERMLDFLRNTDQSWRWSKLADIEDIYKFEGSFKDAQHLLDKLVEESKLFLKSSFEIK